MTVAAPGVAILSTYNTGTTTPDADAYAQLSGTSMAAPHVTGVVALALASDPTLTPAAIRALLVGNVKAPASGCSCGAGIVDAGAVVAAAEAGPSPTPPPTPEPTPDPSLPPDSTAPTVTAFGIAGDTPTGEAAVPFSLMFSEGIRNLEPADFVIAGTALGCYVDAAAGSGAQYTITVRGCSEGTVSLTLKAGAIEDGSNNAGPATPSPTATVLVDRTGPIVHAPAVALRTAVSLTNSRLPVRVSWSATDPGGAGVAGYEVFRTPDGGQSWVLVASPTSPAINTSVPSSGTAAYVVGGVDAAGNPGDLAFGSTFRPTLVQESSGGITYHGTWKHASSTRYSHGSARSATKAGASASYRFTGRAIGFVSRTGPDRGVVRIYLGKTKVATIDLRSTSASWQRVVWARTFSTRVTKTLRIVVAGTSGRPRVDLDAIEVLR